MQLSQIETQLTVMQDMQDAMNSRVNDDWRTQQFQWYRAIWVECAELMDHYGWKWWKHQSPDIEQVKLELIDIWHFGLSLLLEKAVPTSQILEQLENASQSNTEVHFHTALEEFVEYTLINKNFSIPLFTRLLYSIDMSFDELYAGYIGKNVLNFFRQDHGYKEGTYRKVWDGREDNEHLVDLVGTLDHADSEFKSNLYAALKARYEACSV